MQSRNLATVIVAASLVLLAGCGSDEPVANTSPQTAGSTSQAPTPDPAATDPAKDSDKGPAGGATYTDPAADSLNVAVSGAGFDPSSITVPLGGSVTFTGSDDGPHGLYVGDLDSYSVMRGLTATFTFSIAGTYTVFDEISEAEATVTVS